MTTEVRRLTKPLFIARKGPLQNPLSKGMFSEVPTGNPTEKINYLSEPHKTGKVRSIPISSSSSPLRNVHVVNLSQEFDRTGDATDTIIKTNATDDPSRDTSTEPNKKSLPVFWHYFNSFDVNAFIKQLEDENDFEYAKEQLSYLNGLQSTTDEELREIIKAVDTLFRKIIEKNVEDEETRKKNDNDYCELKCFLKRKLVLLEESEKTNTGTSLGQTRALSTRLPPIKKTPVPQHDASGQPGPPQEQQQQQRKGNRKRKGQPGPQPGPPEDDAPEIPKQQQEKPIPKLDSPGIPQPGQPEQQRKENQNRKRIGQPGSQPGQPGQPDQPGQPGPQPRQPRQTGPDLNTPERTGESSSENGKHRNGDVERENQHGNPSTAVNDGSENNSELDTSQNSPEGIPELQPHEESDETPRQFGQQNVQGQPDVLNDGPGSSDHNTKRNGIKKERKTGNYQEQSTGNIRQVHVKGKNHEEPPPGDPNDIPTSFATVTHGVGESSRPGESISTIRTRRGREEKKTNRPGIDDSNNTGSANTGTENARTTKGTSSGVLGSKQKRNGTEETGEDNVFINHGIPENDRDVYNDDNDDDKNGPSDFAQVIDEGQETDEVETLDPMIYEGDKYSPPSNDGRNIRSVVVGKYKRRPIAENTPHEKGRATVKYHTQSNTGSSINEQKLPLEEYSGSPSESNDDEFLNIQDKTDLLTEKAVKQLNLENFFNEQNIDEKDKTTITEAITNIIYSIYLDHIQGIKTINKDHISDIVDNYFRNDKDGIDPFDITKLLEEKFDILKEIIIQPKFSNDDSKGYSLFPIRKGGVPQLRNSPKFRQTRKYNKPQKTKNKKSLKKRKKRTITNSADTTKKTLKTTGTKTTMNNKGHTRTVTKSEDAPKRRRRVRGTRTTITAKTKILKTKKKKKNESREKVRNNYETIET